MKHNVTFQTKEQRLDWYKAAKFGLFVHWGPYSIAGVEASWPIMAPELAAIAFGEQHAISEADYVSLAQRFNPTSFDPQAWAKSAKGAGMRYLVFTAKHHDGFCMFDAPGTEYKITNTPYGRDLCAELAEACAEADLGLGFYYSPPDMHHYGYRDITRPATSNWLGEPARPEWDEYLDYMESHLSKLLTEYGDVGLLWFDGLSSHDKYDPPRFHRLIQELSPTTLVNDRLGEKPDFITPEQYIPSDGIPIRSERGRGLTDNQFRWMLYLLRAPGIGALIKKLAQRYGEGSLQLARIPSARCPSPADFQPWETCMTMNKTWAYNPTDRMYKPSAQLIRNLVKVVGRGGNYLLNVGPTPEGTFPPEAEERLRQIGEWMGTNSQAIFDTTYGPLQEIPFAATTAKPGAIYLHLLDWPANGQIVLEGLESVSSISLLATGEQLAFSQLDGKLAIEVPLQAPDPVISILVIRTT
jgi:alpha-L-fucosidase